MAHNDPERNRKAGGHGSMYTQQGPFFTRNPDYDPDFDPYSHLGGEQGREPYRNTQGDHANYIGGPGSGSYGYGAGGHGYSGPEDRGMNRDAASRRGRQWPSINRSYASDASGRNAFSAGYNQQLQRGEQGEFSRDFEQPEKAFTPPPGPHAGKGPKNYQRPDDRICEDVCEMLTHHGDIDASDIEVSCEKGELTLKGTVSDRATRRLAEEAAEYVAGVKDIHNELRVRKAEAGGGAPGNPKPETRSPNE